MRNKEKTSMRTSELHEVLTTTQISSTGTVPLQLYVLEGGTGKLTRPSCNEGERVEQEFIGTSYLIRHPKGTVMWDTGIPDSIAEIEGGVSVVNGTIQWFVPKTLKSQLDEIGVEPATIDYLALSHIHADHIGNVSYFNNAALLVQEAEYNTLPALSKEMESTGLDMSVYAYLESHQSVTRLNGNYDLFGDGSVIIVSAPGHTPGHQVLFVDLPETGPVILGGDFYLTQKERQNAVASSLISDEKRLIENLLKRTKADLWLCHDKEQSERIAHAPAYYK